MLEGLLGLACLVIMGIGAFTIAFAAWYSRAHKKGKEEGDALTANKENVFDELFDGKPVVAYQSTTRTIAVPLVIEGAHARGYELTSNTPMAHGDLVDGRDLVFTKRD